MSDGKTRLFSVGGGWRWLEVSQNVHSNDKIMNSNDRDVHRAREETARGDDKRVARSTLLPITIHILSKPAK